MTILWKSLYTYRCSTCQGMVATAPVKATANLYRCSRCHAWLRFLFATPIITPQEQALAQRGLVFHTGTDRLKQPRCSVCRDVLGEYAVALPDGTPCHYRCSPAYLERQAEVREVQRLADEERRTALKGSH